MNVRFGGGTVRFRISYEELQLLLTGKKIEETLTLAGKTVLLTIDPSADGETLDFIYDAGLIGLKVSKSSLQGLDENGRKKGGIVSNIGGLSISLQVDLKTYSRTKQD